MLLQGQAVHRDPGNAGNDDRDGNLVALHEVLLLRLGGVSSMVSIAVPFVVGVSL